MSYIIGILCAVCAGAAWLEARAARRAAETLSELLRAKTPQAADEEAARRAKEAIERFNNGIASILGFDAGAKGGEGL